jgi:putative (di)nucleoside polyphosphate hydrolase
MVDRENLKYRKCVGIVLINDDKDVFVGQRRDRFSEAWQMPQGGVEEGEELIEAAKRELKEEIGTNNIEIFDETDNWYKYDIPDKLIPKLWDGKYRGQKQKWFIARFLGDDSEINIETEEPEFSRWGWIEYRKLPDVIVEFKRDLYEQILEEFKHHFEK